MKQFRNPTTVHPPLAGYTHQIEVTEAEHILFISGQIGMDVDGNIPTDSVKQFANALDNVIANLKAADYTLNDLVKLNMYITDTEMDPTLRAKILNEKLGKHKPCMTLLFVVALANPQLKVEIEAYASHDS